MRLLKIFCYNVGAFWMNHKIRLAGESKFWSRFEFRIAFFALLVRLPFVIYDGLYNSDVPDEYHCPDYDLWIDRADVILGGGVIYRDTSYPVRTPPLASYILLPPAIFADGHIAAFELYFSLFDVIAAVLLYRIFLRGVGVFKGEVLAKRCAIFYVFNPFVIASSTLRGQDESIIVVFFLLFIYFLIQKQYNKAALFLGLGGLIRPTIGLLLPLLIFAKGTNKERLERLGITASVVIVGVLPFFILAGSDAMDMTGRLTSIEGVGILYLLVAHGYDIPLAPFTALFIISYLAISYFVIIKKIDPWPAALLIISVFLLAFTKVHSSYYLFALVFAAPFVLNDKKLLVELSAIFPPAVTFIDIAKSSKHSGEILYLASGIVAWLIVTVIILHLVLFTWKTSTIKKNKA